MIFLIESVILCALFTLVIIPRVLKDPIRSLFSYPPVIIERVKSLPQYEGKIPTHRRKLSVKLTASLIAIIILGILTYYSGAKTFLSAFLYSYALWNVINWYDALVLDSIWFCHDKRCRIAGTEDMVKEYESPWFHIIGSFKGMIIGAVACLICAGVVFLFGFIGN